MSQVPQRPFFIMASRRPQDRHRVEDLRSSQEEYPCEDTYTVHFMVHKHLLLCTTEWKKPFDPKLLVLTQAYDSSQYICPVPSLTVEESWAQGHIFIRKRE